MLKHITLHWRRLCAASLLAAFSLSAAPKDPFKQLDDLWPTPDATRRASGAPGPEPYLAELAAFSRWLDRYGDVPVMYPHGLSLSRFMRDGVISIPEVVWEPLAAPNVMVEILIPIFQGAIWEYPYVEARPVIREYYERLGPDRLCWGSDMPNVERHCTYKQSLDYLRNHCDFIPPDDMAKICGGNVARLFGA